MVITVQNASHFQVSSVISEKMLASMRSQEFYCTSVIINADMLTFENQKKESLTTEARRADNRGPKCR